MSTIRREISSVQFVVDAKLASAAMNALDVKAKDLNRDMTAVKDNIAALGNVAPDDTNLVAYQRQLRQLTRDYNDVIRAQREYVKGAAAADKLFVAARAGNIESLNAREIKAGQNALRTRMSSLSPDNAEDAKKLSAMRATIEEGEKVLVRFQSDVQNAMKTLAEGGSLPKKALEELKTTLMQLRDMEVGGSEAWVTYGKNIETVTGKLSELGVKTKQASGAIADANDARRVAKALTEEGTEALRREIQAAKEKADTARTELETLRGERESRQAVLRDAEQQIATTREQIAVKQQEYATIVDTTKEEKRSAKEKADAAKAVATAAEGAAKTEQEAYEKLRSEIDGLLQKQVELKTKLEELGKTPVKPTVDITELQKMQERVAYLQSEIISRSSYMPTRGLQAELDALLPKLEELKKGSSEAAQKLTRELANAKRDLADVLDDEEKANKALKQFGITTADIADETKLQAAAEKALAEEERTRLELAQQMLEVRKQIGQESLKDSRIVGSKNEQAFYRKNKGVLEDEWWKQEAGGGSIGRMYKYLNDIADDPELKAEFQENVGLSVKDAMRVAGQKMREVLQEAMKRGIKVDDALSDFEDGYGHGPATHIKEFFDEFNGAVTEKEEELIRTRRKKLDAILDVVADPGDELDPREERLTLAKTDLKGVATGHYGTDTSLAENVRLQQEEVSRLEGELQKLIETEERSVDVDKEKERVERELAQNKADLAKRQEALTEQANKTLAANQRERDAVEQSNKAADERRRIDGESKRAREEANRALTTLEKTEEKHAATIQQEGEAIDGINHKMDEQSSIIAESDRIQKQAATNSIQAWEDSKKMLMEENRTIDTNSEKYRENLAMIENLDRAIKETTGEWMSYSEAQNYAAKAGTDGFLATTQQMQQATQAMERQKDALIKLIQQKQKDGLATDAEEKELKELEKQLKDLKFEQDNFNMSHEKMEELLKEPKKAADLDELRAVIKRADGELHRMHQSLGENNEQYKAFAEQVRNAKNELKMMEGQSKATASAFEKAWSRLKTYVTLYVGAAISMQKIAATMGDLMELSDKMGEVRKTTGFTADEVGRLSNNLAKLDTRTSLTQLMELSSLAGSVGLKTQEQVQGFTEAADQLIVALPELGNESARTIIKIANATGDLEKNGGDVRETLEKVGSTIIALRANSASAAGPITDFVSRVGAVGAQAGISIDQIAALGSTIDALGGRVEMSATALSRMIPAIRNNTFEVARAIGMTEKELKGMSAMEQMVTIFQKLRDGVKQYNTDTEEGMNAMADNVEAVLSKSPVMAEVMKELNQQGARAGIVFGLLSQNVDELQKQLGIAGEAYRDNIALQEEFNKMNDTAAARWARLKNQIEEMWVSDTGQRLLGDIIDLLRKLVDLISMDGPLGSAIRLMIVTATLWKVKWLEAIGAGLIAFGNWIASLSQSTVATTANTTATNVNTAAKGANAVATKALGNANAEAAVKTEALANAQATTNKVMKANIYGAVAAAVVWLGVALYNTARRSKEASKYINAVASAEENAKNESIKERAELERLYRASQNRKKSFEERKQALRNMVGDEKYKQYYENLSTESDLASAAASAYKELAAEIMATAKARALEAKAQELYEQRLKLETEKDKRQKWMDDNRAAYERAQKEYEQREKYVEESTGGATSGFQESQVAQAGVAQTKPAIIDKFERAAQAAADLDEEIGEIDKGLARLDRQVSSIKPQVAEGGTGGTGGGGTGGDNPYGTFNRVTSPYEKWDADSLVARRKEMLERVRTLANGADVQKVMSEDAKFISEAVRKNIKTTEQAIEWYNAERLKIQEALHQKHLTNTGDWMDPTKEKAAHRTFINEMAEYLKELDAYYTERKTKIQEARTEEGVTEAEARNRTLANEMEWHQRRAELQKLYAEKSAEVTEAEQTAIYNIIAQRTGDSADFIQKSIGNTIRFAREIEKSGEKGAAIVGNWRATLGLGWERDFMKQQAAVTQQMKAIQDIIDKERPFNGITKNLRENLVTMGILTADMTKERNKLMAEGKDMTEFNEKQTEAVMKRTAFMLGEAEHAYSTTINDVMERMGKEGMQAWADAIRQSPEMQEAMMAQLRSTYDQIQEAIKKEASLWKKEAEIMWNNVLMPDGKTSMKDAADQAVAALSLAEGRVSRANSLIGAGQASERVADKLAIKQMQVQLAMQEHYYNLLKQRGEAAVKNLREQAKEAKERGDIEEATRKTLDAQHAEQTLNLATAKEETELAKQREAIIAKTEESQAKLYKELREWADLFYSSMQNVFEASHAGDAEYYNERAKLDLTGKGGPGAGTYVVIDDAGTSDAKAHYEYLDERQALEREHEIEVENARAEAWKQMMDDINMKMAETITDQLNAMWQNAAVDANTAAVQANTEALLGMTGMLGGVLGGVAEGGSGVGISSEFSGDMGLDENGVPNALKEPAETDTPQILMPWQTDPEVARENLETNYGAYKEISIAAEQEKAETLSQMYGWTPPSYALSEEQLQLAADNDRVLAQSKVDASNDVLDTEIGNQNKMLKGEQNTDRKMASSSSGMYAKMTQAANLYGVAYQAMSNDNLDTAQKFEMIALQAAGNAAMAALSVGLEEAVAKTTVNQAVTASKDTAEHGSILGPILTAMSTAVLGGLMGLATSKIMSSKSKIAQITGANQGAHQGRISTGMLTYAEGNVNEFTDPATLTSGRYYNVDAADGKTYRAKYTGKDAKTHITSGPEFHLVGEKGREAIIDAHTTRNIQINDPEIWRSIQTLYNGGSLRHPARSLRRGVPAFAEGNVDDFDVVDSGQMMSDLGGYLGSDVVSQLQVSLDRNSEVLERALRDGIPGVFNVYGPDGLVASYDKGKKTLQRYGEKY